MNKVIDILKITNYDKFKCIADKCRFTCCDGWDVSIDTDTYNKWKKENDKAEFILNNVKIRKCGSKTGYFINKENHEACPLLDKQGLCQVVKSLGEEYLSSTCHRFPRIENVFEDKKELSLSCACPEVVELISSINGKINIISENDTNLKSNLLELRIREVLIDIMQQEGFSLGDKLIVSFQMLLTVLEKENFKEEGLLKELERYKNKGNMQGLIDMYKEIESDINDSVEEINYLFLDIIKNYKEVSNFEILLRYAVFLKYCMNENKEIDVEDIKDYIVVFSRIIGNNTEAVIEFFRDGFGEPVLEIGYLCFITLF